MPQSNDVDLDGRGLIYLVDRLNGLDVLEFTGLGLPFSNVSIRLAQEATGIVRA